MDSLIRVPTVQITVAGRMAEIYTGKMAVIYTGRVTVAYTGRVAVINQRSSHHCAHRSLPLKPHFRLFQGEIGKPKPHCSRFSTQEAPLALHLTCGWLTAGRRQNSVSTEPERSTVRAEERKKKRKEPILKNQYKRSYGHKLSQMNRQVSQTTAFSFPRESRIIDMQ